MKRVLFKKNIAKPHALDLSKSPSPGTEAFGGDQLERKTSYRTDIVTQSDKALRDDKRLQRRTGTLC